MENYRISKYNLMHRNQQGVYTVDEWTSWSDIGKVYQGIEFTKEDYLKTESLYCNVIHEILTQQGVKVLKVCDLEKTFSLQETSHFLSEKSLQLTEEERYIIQTIHEKQKISIEKIKAYVKLLLRDCFWCILADTESDAKVSVEYDYYVHLICNALDRSQINAYEKLGIYVE